MSSLIWITNKYYVLLYLVSRVITINQLVRRILSKILNIFIVVGINIFIRIVSSFIWKTNKYYVLVYLVSRVRTVNQLVRSILSKILIFLLYLVLINLLEQ